MPIEDEYDFDLTNNTNPNRTMSKAELRRSNKPIMEKKRRARINHCLNELKNLILDAMKKDPARHSKLEKADILEMTVKHLQTVQRQQLAVAVATDPNVLHKFKTGFSECATEVSRYIGHLDGVDPAVRQRLVGHLSQCVNGLQQLTPFSFMGSSPPSATTTATFPTPQVLPGPSPVPQVPFPAGDVNNNHTRTMSGLQLIPSRLPSGELALVVPNNNNSNSQPFFPPPSTSNIPSSTVTSGAIDRSHPSAFTAVTRTTSPRPLMSPVSSSSEDSSSSYPQSPPPPVVAFKPPAPRQEPQTRVKLELKTMAVASSSSSFSRLTSSVGTSTSPPPQSRHALDFSMKPPPPRKRPADSELLHQEPKVQRFSLHVSTHREPVVLPRVSVPPNRQPPACAGSNDSMWRPW